MSQDRFAAFRAAAAMVVQDAKSADAYMRQAKNENHRNKIVTSSGLTSFQEDRLWTKRVFEMMCKD